MAETLSAQPVDIDSLSMSTRTEHHVMEEIKESPTTSRGSESTISPDPKQSTDTAADTEKGNDSATVTAASESSHSRSSGDTDDHDEDINIGQALKEVPPSRHSAVDQQQRRSTSSPSITLSLSLAQPRTASQDSQPPSKSTPQNDDPLTSSSHEDPPEENVHSPSVVSRRHSATEFQKFRDQLHSVPANPTVQPDNDGWHLHPNPHRPKTKTEILRIERIYTPIALPRRARVSQIANFDVLIPRFSPAYPPVLREYGINEGEWRGFIEHVNAVCMEAFDPFRWSNVAINVLALLSCWLSEWIMPNLTKRVLVSCLVC